ncbi:MAG TPA: sodium:proton exchanger [Pseudonocardiaceae bacterium]|nr:sodium:proton exchanger [Pseudonocardiaceae bacterium]
MTAGASPRARLPLQLILALLVSLPGAYLGAADYLGLPHPEMSPLVASGVFGIAIVGAAFVLSWAAEAAQVDISAGLALSVLALLAVLPEYAVDFVFTYQAGQVYEQNGACVPNAGGANPCSLALANMTGANRVLVGVGWPLVVLVATWAALRNRRAGGEPDDDTLPGEVRLAPTMSADVVFLGIATLYSLTLPLRSTLTLVDAGVLVTIFALYAWRLSKAPSEKPELVGVAAWVGEQVRWRRRTLVITFFAVAGLMILATAEHFSKGLVSTGAQLGVEQFLLVQWVAPLASESPELIVACLYAVRLMASKSLGTLLSSKVNQWTLLVGTIPVVFALSAGTTDGLPIDSQQRLELLLTAAQSLFAVAILVNLSLTVYGAVGLLSLFTVQFIVSITMPQSVNQVVILVLSAVYIALAIGQMIRLRRQTVQVIRDGLVTPFPELGRVPTGA